MKAKYVDGYVLTVPKGKLGQYRKMAKVAGKIWIKNGALEYYECVGDDLEPDMGVKMMTFPKLARMKPGEAVIFSFVTYKSKAHRNSVNKKVMKIMKDDPSCQDEMPFDMKRMAYGGFKVLVDGS